MSSLDVFAIEDDIAPDARVKASAPEIVHEGLRRAILNGEYVSGTQLRQDELAARFGTSRIPVREALRQLEAEGLVTIETNRGATVKVMSLDEVKELLDIRIMLECPALQWAIPGMVLEDFKIIEARLNEYEEATDPSTWGELNWLFHSALYEPCARPRLLAMIESNYGHVGRFTRLNLSIAVGKERAVGEHRELLALCKAGQTEKAASLLKSHIKHARKSLVASVRHGARGRTARVDASAR